MVVGEPRIERHVEKADLPYREHLGNAIERLGQIPRGIANPHRAAFFGDEDFVARQELEAPGRLQFVGQRGHVVGHAGVIGRPRLSGESRVVVFLFRRARFDRLAFDRSGRRKPGRIAVLQGHDARRRAGGIVHLIDRRIRDGLSQNRAGNQAKTNQTHADHQLPFHVQPSFDFVPKNSRLFQLCRSSEESRLMYF